MNARYSLSCVIAVACGAANAPESVIGADAAGVLDDAADVAQDSEPADTADTSDAFAHPSFLSACTPCMHPADCAADVGAICLYVTTGSRYCTHLCNVDDDCPTGFSCKGKICLVDGGACVCSPWAVASGNISTCYNSSVPECVGIATCVTEGFAPSCNVEPPSVEVCNGYDDDCNGATDDDPGGSLCNDGNVCTEDHCVPGLGTCVNTAVQHAPCAGSIPCAVYECDVEGSCIPMGLSACAGDACTTTLCEFGKGCVGAPLNCDDGNPCTAESCDPALGCTKSLLSGACDDGDPCTSGDTCVSSACGGWPTVCSDGVDCTNDWCVPGKGCIHDSGGQCDDGNICTSDSCAKTGCVHLAVDGPCTDANLCTSSDLCISGLCTGVTATNCDDGESCTVDSCSPIDGCMHLAQKDGTFCTNICGDSNFCLAGTCAGANGKAALTAYNITAVTGVPGGGYLVGGNITSSTTPQVGLWKNGGWAWVWSNGLPFGTTIAAIHVSDAGPIAVSTNSLADEIDWLDWQGKFLSFQTGMAGGSSSDSIIRTVNVGDSVIAIRSGSLTSSTSILKVSKQGKGWELDQTAAPGNWHDMTVQGTEIVVAGQDQEGQAIVLRVDVNGKVLWQKTLPFGQIAALVTTLQGVLLAAQKPGENGTWLVQLADDGTVLQTSQLANSTAPVGMIPLGENVLMIHQLSLDAVRISGELAWQVNNLPFDWFWYQTIVATDGMTIFGRIDSAFPKNVHLLDSWGSSKCPAQNVCLALPAAACDDGDLGTIDLCDNAHGGCWHKPTLPASACTDSSACTTDSWKNGVCSHVLLANGSACDAGCGIIGACEGLDCVANLPVGTTEISVGTIFLDAAAADISGDDLWLATTQGTSMPTLARLQMDGKPLWIQQFPIVGGANIQQVKAAKNGVAMAGIQGGQKFWLARVDGNATALWHHEFTVPDGWHGSVGALEVLPDGFVLGGFQGFSDYFQAVLLRTDANGKQIWRRDFANPHSRISALQRAGNQIAAAGDALDDAVGTVHPTVTLLAPDGTTLWTLPLQGLPGAHINALIQLQNGDLLAAGSAVNEQLFTAQVTMAGALVQQQLVPNSPGQLKILKMLANGSLRAIVTKASANTPQLGVRLLVLDPLAHLQRVQDLEIPATATAAFTASSSRIVAFSTGTGITLSIIDAFGNTSCATSGTCFTLNASSCNDNNPCTSDRCDSDHGGCWYEPIADSPACDDGNPCTTDGCDGGACTHVTSSDGISCGSCGGSCVSGQCVGGGYANVIAASIQSSAVTSSGMIFMTLEYGDLFLCTSDWGGNVLSKRKLNFIGSPPQGLDHGLHVIGSSGSIAWGTASGLYRIDSIGNVTKISTNIVSRMSDLGSGMLGRTSLQTGVEITGWDAQLTQLWDVMIPGSTFLDVLPKPTGGIALVFDPAVSLPKNKAQLLKIVEFDAKGQFKPEVKVANFAPYPYSTFLQGDDLISVVHCTGPDVCIARVHAGQVLWTRAIPGVAKVDALVERGDGTALITSDYATGVLDSDGRLRWHRATGIGFTGWPAIQLSWPNAVLWTDSAVGHLTDAWLNPDCATSGPCVGKTLSDCSDGNDCTFDDCDALHGGCFHPTVSDGAACGSSGTCNGGKCSAP